GGGRDVQAGYLPGLAVHVRQERTPTAAKIEEPAGPLPRKDPMFLGRPVAHFQPGQPPARTAYARSSVRSVNRRVELADAFRVGARAGKTQAAYLALDHRKPESGTPCGGVRSLDQEGPVPPAAQETIWLLPDDDRPCPGHRGCQVTRKK